MGFTITVHTEGPLFNNPRRHMERAIKQALEQTGRYAVGYIGSNTPVRTGRLKAGWKAYTRQSQLEIANSTPYTPFAEKRVQMVKRSERAIQTFLNQELDSQIEKELN